MLADLLQAVRSETPYGGLTTTFDSLGVAWLSLGARRSRERTEAGVSRAVATLKATTRADGRLMVGRILRFGGGDWSIAGVETEDRRPGRMVLSLERER